MWMTFFGNVEEPPISNQTQVLLILSGSHVTNKTIKLKTIQILGDSIIASIHNTVYHLRSITNRYVFFLDINIVTTVVIVL